VTRVISNTVLKTSDPSLTTVTLPALPRGDPMQRVFLQRGLFRVQILHHMLVFCFVHPGHNVTRLRRRFLPHRQICMLSNDVVCGPTADK